MNRNSAKEITKQKHPRGPRMQIKYLLAALVFLTTSLTAFATNYAQENAAYRNNDYGTAMAQLAPLAAQGDADAQMLVGFMYQNGKGVPQDYAEAMKWYKLAANKGNNTASFNLGIMYEQGLGMPIDPQEAFHWFQISANAGNIQSQSKLGFLYGTGKGTAQNYKLALHWTALAAKGGDAGASRNLPIVFYKAVPPETIAYNRFGIVFQSNNNDGSTTTYLVTSNPSMAVMLNTASKASATRLVAAGTLRNCRRLVPEHVDLLQDQAMKIKVAVDELGVASRLATPGTSPLTSMTTDQREGLASSSKFADFVDQAGDAPYYSCSATQ
ncbi:tetratricopeptide repeat protein [Burkholderia vietnamiensis]|uniref:tetratricopeptide repeat protein n=1 Tax=Burkholderia vietnamiensis TaxID=60552 RepID=UPI001B9252A5|nr:tetratricopeptide repeat protein [Burkholderia vietnamiensis]MBR8216268.1 sel1 repeat family protein [Burkholderia vietnamiensis]